METQQVINTVINNSAFILTVTKYIAATIILAVGTVAAAIAQGKIAAKACESLAQNEKAETSIRSTFFLGVLFVETCALYCFILSMIFVFVL
jgi:F-type H+-transporting ATPase subunit c